MCIEYRKSSSDVSSWKFVLRWWWMEWGESVGGLRFSRCCHWLYHLWEEDWCQDRFDARYPFVYWWEALQKQVRHWITRAYKSSVWLEQLADDQECKEHELRGLGNAHFCQWWSQLLESRKGSGALGDFDRYGLDR